MTQNFEHYPSMTDELYDLPKDCDFTQVWNNSGQEFDCSPKLRDPFFSPFQGILINGPDKVVWPRDTDVQEQERTPDGNVIGSVKLMISGLLKLPYNLMGLQGDRAYDVVVVAVSQKAGKSYSGKMQRFGSKPETIEGIPQPDGEEDTTEFFNVDLLSNLEIPLAEDTFSVYANLGPYKSNVITIKVMME